MPSISLAERLPEYALYVDVPPCYDPERVLKDFNALSHEQKGKLGSGIAVAASADEADQEFEKASKDAANAVQNIDNLFVTLTSKLIGLGYPQGLVKTFTKIHDVSRY